MGKLLDTLNHRDVLRWPAPEPHLAPEAAEAEDAEPAPPPPPPEPAAEPPAEDIPFFEVPERPRPLPRPVVRQTAPAVPAAPAPPPPPPAPEVAFTLSPAHRPHLPGGVAADLTVWHTPDAPASGQFRQVAAALWPDLIADKLHSLLLVPVGDQADRAAAAGNLALALAEGGKHRLLLVDADLKARKLAPLFGQASAPGWSELLLGQEVPLTLQETGWHRLHLLAAGNRLVGANSPLLGRTMRDHLRRLHRRYDLLVVKAPAVGVAAGTVHLLTHACDATCLLVGRGEAGQAAEERCRDDLQREGVRVLGSLVVG